MLLSTGQYPGFFIGGAYLKNRDQIINVGRIGHASSKDARLLGKSGHASPEIF